MEFFSILTKISLYNYTVSIIGSVIGLRHDISDYNEERKGKEPQHENVRVTMKMAIIYPIFASIALVSLFYLYYRFQSVLLLLLIVSMWSCLNDIVRNGMECVFGSSSSIVVTVVSCVIPTAIVILWILCGSPLINNILGVCLTLSAISMIRLPSLKIVFTIFILLFFYDIFWVFFSERFFHQNVMVTVAQQNLTESATRVMQSVGRNVSATYHLEFPSKLMIRSWDGSSFSYLGLGDLFIPGLLFAFIFSFQYYLEYVRRNENQSNGVDEESVLIENNKDVLLPLPSFHRVIRLFIRRNYVTDVIIGNFFGLVLSFLAVILFQHAQVNCGRNDECHSPHFSILFRAH
ncbi:hypothetical protein WA538_001186 [Blastocystis sp. DL]